MAWLAAPQSRARDDFLSALLCFAASALSFFFADENLDVRDFFGLVGYFQFAVSQGRIGGGLQSSRIGGRRE